MLFSSFSISMKQIIQSIHSKIKEYVFVFSAHKRILKTRPIKIKLETKMIDQTPKTSIVNLLILWRMIKETDLFNT